jgi:hypothetical protein
MGQNGFITSIAEHEYYSQIDTCRAGALLNQDRKYLRPFA